MIEFSNSVIVEAINYCLSSIRAGIVADENFQVLVGLVEHTEYSLLYKCFGIVAGHDDADQTSLLGTFHYLVPLGGDERRLLITKGGSKSTFRKHTKKPGPSQAPNLKEFQRYVHIPLARTNSRLPFPNHRLSPVLD